MQHYRAFQLDQNGHIVCKIDLTCADDEDAKQQAEQLLYGYDTEVWHRDRMVALLRPKRRLSVVPGSSSDGPPS
jgi:hypothetical protein